MSNDSNVDTRRLHVLLITADLLLRQLATGLLKMKGHTCASVDSAEAGLAAMPTMNADVLMLDASIPGMPLLEFVAQLRESKTVPVIVIEDALSDEARSQLVARGCNCFLTAPIQPPALFAALSAACGNEDGLSGYHVTVDLEVARGHLSGGEEELRELIEIMIGEAPRFIAGMELGLADGQASDVEREAHSLKGAARVFGSSELVDLAYRLERLAHNSELDQVADQLPQLAEMTQELLSALQSALQEM